LGKDSHYKKICQDIAISTPITTGGEQQVRRTEQTYSIIIIKASNAAISKIPSYVKLRDEGLLLLLRGFTNHFAEKTTTSIKATSN
jgi:hypothetical protein